MGRAMEGIDDFDLQKRIRQALQEALAILRPPLQEQLPDQPQMSQDPMVRLLLRRMEEVEDHSQKDLHEANMRLEKLQSGLSALESELVIAQEQWEVHRGDVLELKQRLDDLVQSSTDTVVELRERLTDARKRQDRINDRLWSIEHHMEERWEKDILSTAAGMLRQAMVDISAETQEKMECLAERLNSKAETAAVDASLDDLEERLMHKVGYDYLQERMEGLDGRFHVKAEISHIDRIDKRLGSMELRLGQAASQKEFNIMAKELHQKVDASFVMAQVRANQVCIMQEAFASMSTSRNMQLNIGSGAGKGSPVEDLTRQQHVPRSPSPASDCSSIPRSRGHSPKAPTLPASDCSSIPRSRGHSPKAPMLLLGSPARSPRQDADGRQQNGAVVRRPSPRSELVRRQSPREPESQQGQRRSFVARRTSSEGDAGPGRPGSARSSSRRKADRGAQASGRSRRPQ